MTKILSGALIEMRELLPDNLMLRRQLQIQDEFTPSPQAALANHRCARYKLYPHARVCCVASYLMVLASAGKLRPDHLAYLRLIVEPKRPSSKATGGGHTMPPSDKNMAARASGLSWSHVDAGLHPNSCSTMACCAPYRGLPRGSGLRAPDDSQREGQI